MLPPHNVIVEGRPDLAHESLAMLPGEEFDITFSDPVITPTGVLLTKVLA